MKKVISLMLSIAMLLSCGSVSYAAFDAPKLSREQWDTLYNENFGDNTLPMLCVGADETQVSLCWHADKSKAKPEVLWSKNADMSAAQTFKGITTDAETADQLVCRVTITGLEENTTYYYQWNRDNGLSGICKYETKSFGSHKALVIGDVQITEYLENQSAEGYGWNSVLAEALEKNPDVSYFVTPGDNTSSGQTAAEWQTVLTPQAMRSLPMAMAIGNHDKKGMTYNYYTNMPNEYYGKFFSGLDRDFWFRYGDVLYLFYDSTSGNAPDHMAMTKEAVKLNQDAKWRIGVVHHGIYGAGDSIGDMETEILLKAIFAPIFETYDLDLVITGHTHSQGRSHFMEQNRIAGVAESGKTYTDPEGVVYINSNSVNNPLVYDVTAEHLAFNYQEEGVTTYTTLEFSGDTMTVETRRGDNSELLDSLSIKRTQQYNENSFKNIVRRILYLPIEFIGFVYTEIDTLVRLLSK
ncbi:MAG: metallophosphoesterase family protein [Clostridia bacterium]|nr:metallophosphoesterase family protein [Clostridia bacterium]